MSSHNDKMRVRIFVCMLCCVAVCCSGRKEDRHDDVVLQRVAVGRRKTDKTMVCCSGGVGYRHNDRATDRQRDAFCLAPFYNGKIAILRKRNMRQEEIMCDDSHSDSATNCTVTVR